MKKSKSMKAKLTKEQHAYLARYDAFKEEWMEQWPDTEMPLTKEMWLHATISSEYWEGLYDGIQCIKKMNDKRGEAYYRKYPKTDDKLPISTQR